MNENLAAGAKGRRYAAANVATVLAGCLLAGTVFADELDQVTFGTSWYAQAEHGGFYQAVATGIYEEYGLDVTIQMGGPQVNGMQLLLAGRLDFNMGYPVGNINAVAEDLPAVTVAAPFQSDPQVLLAHPHIESLEEIVEKQLPVFIASSAHTTFWPWLQAQYGFTDEQVRPYTFSVAPFLNDERVVQQGYLSSEPFAMQRGGVEPSIFLFADYGYPPYAQTIETRRELVENDPDLVRRFVEASMKGWASYFENPEPGNALIKEDNPEMTDEQIAFGIEKMLEYGLVLSGDAETYGIGHMTDERWQATFDFMAEAGLVPADLDFKQAYSLDFLPEEPVIFNSSE